MQILKKRMGKWYARCPDCPPTDCWREVTQSQASNIRIRKSSGRCKPCSQKEILVEVTCPECGNPRQVKASTARHYKSHKSVPMCPECSLLAAPRGWLKGCGTMHQITPIWGPQPVIPAGEHNRCHGLWDGCKRYDTCLAWHEATVGGGRAGWVCAWNHGTKYHEFVTSEQIREAFDHAVVHGLAIDGHGSSYACSLTRTSSAL